MVKLQQIRGIDRGFRRPTFIFPISRPLHRSMSSSLIASTFFGSSSTNGRVDLQYLSTQMVSDVLFFFIRCPHSPWPHKESAHLAAADFPRERSKMHASSVYIHVVVGICF